ncbi:MAG: ribonuclease III [Clostridia bacterium]|nr:ribonuclease III [Clostridia bacterium]
MDKGHDKIMKRLQQNLGYAFKDEELLRIALTHASYVKGDGFASEYNERLEFLGDAVLGMITGEKIYSIGRLSEGKMTRIRAQVVNEAALADIARSFMLGDALRMGAGEERSGGREKPSILADAMEAVIGALYLDAGFERAREFVLMCIDEKLNQAILGAAKKDSKTALQEYVQGRHIGTLKYVVIDERGPAHKCEFTIAVMLNDEIICTGVGTSKQNAGQNAAQGALIKLKGLYDNEGKDTLR